MRDHERDVTTTGMAPWKSPVALSVTLHALILGIALAGWSWTSTDHEPPPRSISARLITQQEPEPSPVVEPDDQQKHVDLKQHVVVRLLLMYLLMKID